MHTKSEIYEKAFPYADWRISTLKLGTIKRCFKVDHVRR